MACLCGAASSDCALHFTNGNHILKREQDYAEERVRYFEHEQLIRQRRTILKAIGYQNERYERISLSISSLTPKVMMHAHACCLV